MARASFIKKAVGRPRRRSKSAGTYLRHFTETLCRAEITIAIVIIGCVMRTMRLVDAWKSLPIVCRASRVLIENVKATEKTFVSPECADRKNTTPGRGGDRGEPGGGAREGTRMRARYRTAARFPRV